MIIMFLGMSVNKEGMGVKVGACAWPMTGK